MIVNYCFHVFGATTADLDAVSVEDFVEAVVFKKMLIKQIQKVFAGSCQYIFTERGVKPDCIYFMVTFVESFCVNRVVLQFLFVVRLVQFILTEWY